MKTYLKNIILFLLCISFAPKTNNLNAGIVNTCYQSGKIIGGGALFIRGTQITIKCITSRSFNQPRNFSTQDKVLLTLIHTLGYIGCGEVIMQDGLNNLGCDGNNIHRKFTSLYQKIKNYLYQKPAKEKPQSSK